MATRPEIGDDSSGCHYHGNLLLGISRMMVSKVLGDGDEMLRLMQLGSCYSDKGLVLRQKLPLAGRAHAMEALAYKKVNYVATTTIRL
jgi:hypothetical protein